MRLESYALLGSRETIYIFYMTNVKIKSRERDNIYFLYDQCENQIERETIYFLYDQCENQIERETIYIFYMTNVKRYCKGRVFEGTVGSLNGEGV